MFSDSEIRNTTAGFGRFLAHLFGLAAFGVVVWAGLFAAASWEHEQQRRPGIVGAPTTVARIHPAATHP
jgi:hypothetical protein